MQKLNKYQKHMTFILVVVMVLLCVGNVIIRAVTVPITYDEGFTYCTYVNNIDWLNISWWINTYTNSWLNNHLLNTLLIGLLEQFTHLKYCDFLIRTPNIIAMLLYVYIVIKMYKKQYINILCVCLLLLNSYMNEFFGLARGYGLATSLVVVGLYFYQKYKESNNGLNIVISIGLLTLSTIANTITILLVVSLVITILVELCVFNHNLISIIKRYWAYFGFIILILVIMSGYQLNNMSDTKPQYPKATNGYISSTFIKLAELYFNNRLIAVVITMVLFFIILISFIVNRQKISQTVFLFPFLIYIIVTIILCIIGKGYPSGRSLIPFIPLYILFLNEEVTNLLNGIYLSRTNKLIVSIMKCLLIAVIFISYFNKLNYSYTTDWEQYADAKQYIFSLAIDKNEKNINHNLDEQPYLYYKEKLFHDYGFYL